jgi:GAF domain-containing protein
VVLRCEDHGLKILLCLFIFVLAHAVGGKNEGLFSIQVPGTPIDEDQRVATLHCLGLLDTPPSESFDRITWLVAELLDVPIALVSLVDQARQWFKSRVGLQATETSREVSFCAHAVFSRQLLNVPDATRDPRFAGNPLVTGPPNIRAYVGVPIFSRDFHAIGTLCAIDTRPRAFFERHLQGLRHLARVLEEQIHAHEVEAALRGQIHRLEQPPPA